MPGNAWGTSQPNANLQFTNSGDTACSAGAETNVASFANPQPASPGNWGLLITGFMSILFGGTAPTAMSFGARFAALADIDAYAVAAASMVANATTTYPLMLYLAQAGTIINSAGNALNLTVNPTGQAVTFKGTGSRFILQWVRGIDA